MANVIVGNQWLGDHGAWGDLQWSTVYRGGCEAASWRMDSAKHTPFHPGDLVTIAEDGYHVWAGTLLEPDGDTLHARGLYRQAESAQSVDSGGNIVTVPDFATWEAVQRGLLSWKYAPLSLTPTSTPTGPVTVAEVLDTWADSASMVWHVNGRRELRASAPPAVPKWHVAPGSSELRVAADSYVTTLLGRYQSSTTTHATVQATDAKAAAKFGPREDWIDLTKMGVMTAPQAQAIVNSRLAMGAARPGWATGLQLARYEITTPGGSPAGLSSIFGGDLFRVHGQYDMTIASGTKPYIDVIADEVTYVDGADTIQIKPVDLQARTLSSVLTIAASK